jgi:hypothetical protein
MIGLKRLDKLQSCIVDVLQRGVQGDLIETGVWRGGAAIFMRAILKAYGDTSRVVWLADSFRGLPKPNAEEYPADLGSNFFEESRLSVSVEEVRRTLRSIGCWTIRFSS